MWEFRPSRNGQRWGWKYFFKGRLQRLSTPEFQSMNDAIRDANAHGFEMHCHRWEVFYSWR